MRAAIYLRVSTDEQQHANQLPDCERLCAARGWEPLLVVETESGAKKRPGWASVLELARKGEVRAVVIWALDRAGRSRVQVAHDLGELFRWGVQVVSVRDPWLDQAPGPLRDLLVQVLGWLAEGERDHLIARTKAGQARARAQGRMPGRPRTPPAVVARILRERRQLLIGGAHPTPTEIARALGVPRSTVRDVLAKNPLPATPANPAEKAAS
jgi:DNA invertase Pin-like site-specific DNA recombinase